MTRNDADSSEGSLQLGGSGLKTAFAKIVLAVVGTYVFYRSFGKAGRMLGALFDRVISDGLPESSWVGGESVLFVILVVLMAVLVVFVPLFFISGVRDMAVVGKRRFGGQR